MPHLLTCQPLRRAVVLLTAVVVLGGALFATTAAATEAPDEPATDETGADGTGVDEDVLIVGAGVYTDSCSGCHQPGGVGLPGQFPPLVNNPNIDDTDYLRSVIANGREGELVVNGVTYNGRMPAFSTLPDDEVDALVAFLQGGLVVPTGGGAAEVPGAAGDDDALPAGANLMMTVAFLIAGGFALFIFLPRLTSAHGGLDMPWLDASLKAACIVVGFVAFTVFVPDWALQTDTVNKLERPVQDFVGAALWMGGLALTIGAVWWAHREKRI